MIVTATVLITAYNFATTYPQMEGVSCVDTESHGTNH